MRNKRSHGDGSIRSRKDARGRLRWYGEIMLPGSTQRYYCSGETKREVQQQIRRAVEEHEAGRLVLDRSRRTVGVFLLDWLEQVARPGLRPRVHTRYEEIVRLHLLPALGDLPLAKLTPQHLVALYGQKVAGGLSPATVQRVHNLLHRALRDAVAWQMVARNVCDVAKPPRVPKPEMRSFSIEEARRFLVALADEPLEAYYLLAITTGLRQGELLGLQWRDVDWDNRQLQIRRQASRVKGTGWILQEPKSARSRRAVPLIDLSLDALRRHRARQNEQRLAAAVWHENDLVFANGVGRVLEPQNILRRSWLPLLARANLPRIRQHDLRHSMASLMLALGINPKVVQEILGHSQISLTLDVYSHVLPGLQRDAVNRLGDLLTST